jgi:hypothetical protein
MLIVPQKSYAALGRAMQNGRVNFTPRESASPGTGVGDFNTAFQYRQETVQSEADDAIRGNVASTPLNQAYFSPANVQIIQNKIRREVYDRSGGEFLIDPQSVDELMIVMRAMYLQYCKNMPNQIPEQISELNQMVADWVVPKVLAECSMHKTYLRDIQSLPTPMSHPVLMTKSGSKTAAFDRFF